jgi:hypothetical protein
MSAQRDREIGPIGTVTRVVGGVLAIALPIALSGFSWWDAAGALIALPLVATVVAGVASTGPDERASRFFSRGHVISYLAIAAVIGIGIALTFVTPVDGGAVWGFLGVSVLVAAYRGCAGCEVLAIPNAITGRCQYVGCVIYTPIDVAEARWRG